MKYSDSFKNPLWQRKRLEILQRDLFKCSCCNSEDVELHVHHVSYGETEKNKPWTAPNYDLITLCEMCHKVWHNIYDNNPIEYVTAVVELHDRLEMEDIKRFEAKNKEINNEWV